MSRSTVLSLLLLAAALALPAAGLKPEQQPSQTAQTSMRPPGVAQPARPDRMPETLQGVNPAIAQTTTWAQQTADTLASVDAPGRDLAAVVKSVKLGGRGDIPSVVNASTPNYALGSRQRFYVADLTKKTYFQVQATVREVTSHAYWYVSDGYSVDVQALKASAQRFEQSIYPTVRRVFGTEPSPGIDNDPRITVLLTSLPGLNGYFSSYDAYPRAVNAFSNEREMIYIAARPSAPAGQSENAFEATLSHEFQHMVHWNVHRNRDVWVDEGCSEISMYINGYDPGGFDYLFSTHPDTQLNAWSGEPTRSGAHYGASYLFMRYLMDKYGGESFISRLMGTPGLGTEVLDSAVRLSGNRLGFEGAFKDWTVANALNLPGVAGGRYSYPEGGRAQAEAQIRQTPATRSGTVNQYAADYIKVARSTRPTTITFRGNAEAKVIAANPHSGRAFWYANRRDSGDATLTREFDLTRATLPRLSFWVWYDIEAGFDYAYVEVSTDGGKTWSTQRGVYTTTQDPNGANLGNGWTGRSGSRGNSKAAARWVEESVDLRNYAGKSVLVRFQYLTDEGYNGPGFAIDDLRLTATGYTDNAETPGGWAASGFVRIGSVMPQRWFVALVTGDAAQPVQEATVNPAGVGTISLPPRSSAGSAQDATLVIVPLAPKTTEPATYTVTATGR